MIMALVVWAGFDKPTNRRTVRVGATTDSRCHVLVISHSCFLHGFMPIFSFFLIHFFFSFIHLQVTTYVGTISRGSFTIVKVLSGHCRGSFASSAFPPINVLRGSGQCRENTARTPLPQL